MAGKLFETTENPLETAVKMTLLENKVDTAQKELERTKKQLQDAETARDRAEGARKYCVEQVERHAAKDRAKIDWQNLKYTRKIKGLTTEIDTEEESEGARGNQRKAPGAWQVISSRSCQHPASVT